MHRVRRQVPSLSICVALSLISCSRPQGEIPKIAGSNPPSPNELAANDPTLRPNAGGRTKAESISVASAPVRSQAKLLDAPPAPTPPVKINQMSNQQLNDWIAGLQQELQIRVNLSKSFSRAAQSQLATPGQDIEMAFQSLPNDMRAYLEKTLGKSFDAKSTSADELTAVAAIFAAMAVTIQDRLDEAGIERLSRTFPSIKAVSADRESPVKKAVEK